MGWSKREILTATGGRLLQEGASAAFGEVVTDSRAVTQGSVFVALKGERFDAHDFLPDAVRRGACCLVVHKQPRPRVPGHVAVITVDDTLSALGALGHYRRKMLAPKVLAITGSNGKTTTKEMVAAILERASLDGKSLKGRISKTQGNYNNLVGVPLTLLGLSGKEKIAVLELGTNHPGEIRRLTKMVEPDMGLITTVAPAHLEGLKSLAGVAREKGSLFTGIKRGGIAVINTDDPWLRRLGSKFPGRRVTYGSRGQVRAEKVKMRGACGTSFILKAGSARQHVRLGLPGAHNLSNALGAAAMAYGLGVRLKSIARGLKAVSALPMRMELARWKDFGIINDTYNANPASMEAALASLAAVGGKKHQVAILGDMLELGRKTRQCHFELGKKAARYGIDRLYLLGPNAPHVRKGALAGGLKAQQVIIGQSHENIARLVAADIRKGDWLLFKGSRGMKMENVLTALKQIGV
ncbi:MAG: UDP-N-acetylmuramoyl-tripeptide--D-alanyl-D-alanine ligase [Candidatus Binatia bacterium]